MREKIQKVVERNVTLLDKVLCDKCNEDILIDKLSIGEQDACMLKGVEFNMYAGYGSRYDMGYESKNIDLCDDCYSEFLTSFLKFKGE